MRNSGMVVQVRLRRIDWKRGKTFYVVYQRYIADDHSEGFRWMMDEENNECV